MLKQAVILVGGKGTRLGALTRETPKPMLPIEGTPFLFLLLDRLIQQGFSSFVLLAGFSAPVIKAAFPNGYYRGYPLKIIVEQTPLGTAGSLKLAEDTLEDQFIILNGDSLLDVDLRDLAQRTNPSHVITLAAKSVKDAARFGTLKIDGQTVTAFGEKQHSGHGLINGGIYLAHHRLLDHIAPSIKVSMEHEVFPALVEKGLLGARAMDGFFIDIGLPDTYANAQSELVGHLARPIFFFDRDGVLNEDLGYTHKVEDLRWRQGAIEAVKLVTKAGYVPMVVTNQAGIARGYYDWAAVDAFHRAMQSDLLESGTAMADFFHSPFHIAGSIPSLARHSDCRKPGPGLLRQAFMTWPMLDARKSILIGDKESDVAAAHAAGVKGYLTSSERLDQDVLAILTGLGMV